MGWTIGVLGFDSWLEPGISLFTTAYRTTLGSTQPPLQCILGVKWPGCEADHSPPSSAEVKNAWSCTSTPQYVFMVWCLVEHRDNFCHYLCAFNCRSSCAVFVKQHSYGAKSLRSYQSLSYSRNYPPFICNPNVH
jgi:hypothetical protein